MRQVLTFGAGILGSVIAFTALPVQAAWYTYDYDGSVLPTAATPPWAKGGSTSGATAQVFNPSPGDPGYPSEGLTDPGYFQVNSSATSWHYQLDVAATEWNVSDAFTFEVRARVSGIDATTDALVFWVGSSTDRVLLALDNTNAAFDGAAVAPVGVTYDPEQYNVYRITGTKTGSAWTYNLYLNNNPVVAATDGDGSLGGGNVLFGDSGSAIRGLFEIDYIRWNSTQAVAVPEPTSLAGLGIIAAGVLLRRRRQAV